MILDIFNKIINIVEKLHLENQKPDLDKGRRWSAGARTETKDSSRYFLKPFLSDFLDVLENLLEINFEGRFWRVVW